MNGVFDCGLVGDRIFPRIPKSFSTILVERRALVTTVLETRPDLVRVYADPTAVVYLRRTATNADALTALTAVAARPPTSPRPTYFP